MVGIGGGAPSNPSDDPRKDLRLGDVVVSNPDGDYGKTEFHSINDFETYGNSQAVSYSMTSAKLSEKANSFRQAH